MVKNENRLHNLYNNINGFLRYTESRNGVFLGIVSFVAAIATLVSNMANYNFEHKLLMFLPVIVSATIIVISFMPISGLLASKGKERYKRGDKYIKDGIKQNILDPNFIAKLDTKIDRSRFFERLGITEIPSDDHYLEYLFDHCIVTARKVRFKSIMFKTSLYCLLTYIPIGIFLVFW